MARNAGTTIDNNFTNGLVTEATGLNFPENAVVDTDNCVFNPIGKVSRRPALVYEEGGSGLFIGDNANSAIAEYLWEAVDGNGNLSIFVQQLGNNLYFFNTDAQTPLSSQFLGVQSLLTFALNPGGIANQQAQFASGFGRLIVTHPASDPFYVTYNQTTNTFGSEKIEVKTRDFKGSGPRPLPRSVSITPQQRYNLVNQGWTTDRQANYVGKLGFHPSDFEVWWLYKGPDPNLPAQEVFLPLQVVNQVAANEIDRGNSPAPNGSIIINEFYQDRSASSGVGGVPVESSGASRPSTTAFHAGRAFFAGVNYGEWSSKIYFSQIVERPEQFGRCYQENDPTSEYAPDLLPSDGGVINIPDVGRVYKLWSVNTSLLIFAINGVWEVTGSNGIGFSATDYTVKKISSAQTVSASSFVGVDGMPMWWGLDAIYIAASDRQLSTMTIRNISDERIKTFFQSIPDVCKGFAKGAYNPRTQVVQWIYRATPPVNLFQEYWYDRFLNFEIRSNAFYPWSLPESSPPIRGIYTLKGKGSIPSTEVVVDNDGATVTDNGGANVTIDIEIPTTLSATFKYLTRLQDDSIQYSELDDTTTLDWGGLSYRSFFKTGYRIRGGALTKSQANYIRFFNEGSGVIIHYGLWDYANSALTNRWSSPQKVVFSFSDHVYQTRKLKVRGHGLAYQFVIESFENEPFSLIGWSGFETSNERP